MAKSRLTWSSLGKPLEVCSWLTSPLLLISTLAWAVAMSGVEGFYVDALEVRNATSEPLWITPLGARNGKGPEHLLRQFASRARPHVPPIAEKRLRVSAHETRTVLYDGDDDVPSEIVVMDQEGRSGVLSVGNSEQLEITAFAQLAPVPPELAAAANAFPVGTVHWLFLLAGALPVGLFLASWRYE